MGKAIITEALFPEIIERYNQDGRIGAYDLLRSKYGIKSPYFVIKRIIECGKYGYDPDRDCFSRTLESTTDNIFIGLDELCNAAIVKAPLSIGPLVDARPAAMEKLVHELISDRLLILRCAQK